MAARWCSGRAGLPHPRLSPHRPSLGVPVCSMAACRCVPPLCLSLCVPRARLQVGTTRGVSSRAYRFPSTLFALFLFVLPPCRPRARPRLWLCVLRRLCALRSPLCQVRWRTPGWSRCWMTRCTMCVRLRVVVSPWQVWRVGACVPYTLPVTGLRLRLPGCWHYHCLRAYIGPNAGTPTSRQINSPPWARLETVLSRDAYGRPCMGLCTIAPWFRRWLVRRYWQCVHALNSCQC